MPPAVVPRARSSRARLPTTIGPARAARTPSTFIWPPRRLDPSHKLIDLGHDTITGFESGHDVIDYQVAFGLNGQECYLNSQDLIGTLDTNRDGILSAADGGGVSVHGNDITLDLGITIAGNGDPGPANEVAFKGDVTVLGHQSLTAADLGTVAPWTHETAHLVHAGHETLVA